MTPLATIADYDELITALRARQNELGISFEALSELSGLADRSAVKLLTLSAVRNRRVLSRVTLGPLLGALAVRLVVVVDEDQLKRNRSRYIPRSKAHTKSAQDRWSDPNREARRSRRGASAPTASRTDPQISVPL